MEYITGYFSSLGNFGNVYKQTKNHVVNSYNSRPLCNFELYYYQTFHMIANFVDVNHVDCKKCRKMIDKLDEVVIFD
jgi:hypothetical protein